MYVIVTDTCNRCIMKCNLCKKHKRAVTVYANVFYSLYLLSSEWNSLKILLGLLKRKKNVPQDKTTYFE